MVSQCDQCNATIEESDAIYIYEYQEWFCYTCVLLCAEPFWDAETETFEEVYDA